jgi:hypothetical protein
MDETFREDVLAFPPIPLATGSVVIDEAGMPMVIESVAVLVRTVDGREFPVDLAHRHGAWWPPEP